MPTVFEIGVGPDKDALARLQAHFPQPHEPMGEPWFMGTTRHLYRGLCGGVASADRTEFFQALEAITSGTLCFGHLAEWDEWYYHLLGQSVPSANEGHAFRTVSESLISAFMALNPEGPPSQPAYPGLMDDVFATLGRVLLSPDRWNGSEIVVGQLLQRHSHPKTGVWRWYTSAGDFSAMMFLHLKYLPTTAVREWLTSVLAIPSPHWRAQVLVWFLAAQPSLNDPTLFPGDMERSGYLGLHWESSHSLNRDLVVGAVGHPIPFLPPENGRTALATVRAWFSEERFTTWLESISRVDYLERELADLPFTFWETFGTPINHRVDRPI